ncbi:hypothetical protein ACTFIW_013316 [Dictyostelium discoideum]
MEIGKQNIHRSSRRQVRDFTLVNSFKPISIPQNLINDLKKMDSNLYSSISKHIPKNFPRQTKCQGKHEIHLKSNEIHWQPYPVKHSKEELEFLLDHIKELEPNFQRVLNQVLEDLILKSVYPFLDDIFNYSENIEKHYH